VTPEKRSAGGRTRTTVVPLTGDARVAEIARMLQDSYAHAADDMAARALAEAQVEADQIAAATEVALAADADLLSADERAAIEAALGELARRRAGTEHRALVAATMALNRATADLAARRMDRGVARALTGRNVDALT
jgi:molecular chaperone HscA